MAETQTGTTDAQPAASSAAPVTAQSVMDGMTHEERATWQKTGEFPDRYAPRDSSTSDADTDSSSAPPVAQAASTDATVEPASEPGKPAKGAKARIAELDAEIERDRQAIRERLRIRNEVRRERALLDRPDPDARPADSSPAQPTTQAEWARYAAMPDAPKEDQFERFGDFTAAMSLFITDQRWAEHQQREHASRAERQHADAFERVRTGATERIAKYEEDHPDFASKVHPRLLEITPASLMPKGARIAAANVLVDQILKSSMTPQLLEHFSTHEGVKDWQRLAALPPDELLAGFGEVAADLRHTRAQGQTPAPKLVSTAPTLTTVGDRTADTADPVEAAIKAKDLGRYMREQNRRDLAALRG